MNEKNKSKEREPEDRNEALELVRELAMREGLYGNVDTHPFTGNAKLSPTERLKLAIMFNEPETVQRILNLSADTTIQAGNDIDLLHFAEIHGRGDLLPILKAHISKEKPNKSPKKSHKSQK